jgi:hypothetical protein
VFQRMAAPSWQKLPDDLLQRMGTAWALAGHAPRQLQQLSAWITSWRRHYNACTSSSSSSIGTSSSSSSTTTTTTSIATSTSSTRTSSLGTVDVDGLLAMLQALGKRSYGRLVLEPLMQQDKDVAEVAMAMLFTGAAEAAGTANAVQLAALVEASAELVDTSSCRCVWEGVCMKLTFSHGSGIVRQLWLCDPCRFIRQINLRLRSMPQAHGPAKL